jgi:histone acetyltransferase (RNA polymerase elongator complex component)
VSLDTRSREIRHQDIKSKDVANMVIRKYLSSAGEEYFISFEDTLGYLYGFSRLLLGEDTAMIRELHVYGQVEGLKDEKINVSSKEGILKD